MNSQPRIQTRTVLIAPQSHADSSLRKGIVVCVVLLGLAFVLVAGVVRLYQSLNDGSISPWRLVVLFANIFGCVTIVCALHRRGCERSPR